MPERIIVLGLACAAFVVTLGISSWHNGLWHSGDSSTAQDVENAQRTRTLLSSAPTAQLARPFAPAVAAPAPPPPAATPPTPPPPPAETKAGDPGPPAPELTQSTAQSEPSTSPEVDNGERLAEMDRAARHGSRSH